MKKIMLVMSLFTSILMLTADEIKFSWGPMTEENAKKFLAQSSASVKEKAVVEFNMLVQKDSSILSDYNKYMNAWKTIKEKYGNNQKLNILPYQYIINSINIVSEEVYIKGFENNKNKYPILNAYMVKRSIINDNILEEIFNSYFDAVNKNPQLYKAKYFNWGFNFLEKNQFKMKEEYLKANLKKLKRLVYPKINQGDDWKQLAVQIELSLKSLE